ncbi:MAG: hypothetical protein R2728_13180 [Chitinophagales bacterium]
MSDTISKSSKTDQYQAPDYYQLDDLLSEEHIPFVIPLEIG